MKKYKTPNGSIVDESVLRQKYGARFDSLVGNGTFTLHTESVSSDVYKTPNGSSVSESTLREKYGDKFDSLVSDGTLKKKEAGDLDGLASFGGAAVAPSPTQSASKEKNNLAQPNIAIGAGSAFDESGGVDTVLGRPSVYEIVSEDEKVVEKTKPIQAPIETAGKLPDRYQRAKDAALKEVGINKEEFDAASKNSFDIKKDVILSYQGTDFKIKPNRVPEGYSKDIEGARKYAIDLNTILRNPSTDDETKSLKIKELLKVSNLGRLDENKEILSPKDFEYINKITGKNYTSVSPEMVADIFQYEKDVKNGEIVNPISPVYNKRPENPIVPGMEVVAKTDNDNSKRGVKVGIDINKQNNLGKPVNELKKRMSFSLQEEVQGAGEINTLAGDTRSDLQATLKGVDVENIAGRMGQENMTNLFATGLESLKYSNPSQYDILKRRLAEGKTIASAKVAELTNIGAKIIDLRELEKLGRDETTIDQYYTKSNEVGEQLSESFLKRPDLVQKAVSDVIARHYEKDGTALFGKWMVSDKEIDNVPASEFEAAGIDINRPEVKAAINNIKKNEGLLPFDNAIQKDALVRELGRGFIQPLKGTASFIGNIATSDDEKRLQKELEPINNYVSQRSKYFNKRYGGIADAFNGSGQFVSQLMLMEGAIGLFKGVGLAAGGSELMTFVRTPESAIPTAIRQGAKFGNSVIDKSNLFGRLAVPYMQSYDSYHKSALEKTDNPLAAKVYAFVNASMETLSEQMFDNVKFRRQVVADFSNKGFNINKISKILSRGEFDQTALDEIKLLTKNGLKESIEAVYKGSKDLVKESLEEIPVSFTNFVSDALLDPKSVEGRELLPELKDAFLSGLVSFSIPSIIGTSGRLKKIFTDKTTQQDALMIAARNRGDVIDAIYNQLEDGEIEGDEANTRIKILNTAAAALAQMPKSKSDGTPMSEENNSEYLALTVQGKILEEQNKQIDDESVRTINEEKIKEINAKKVEILKSKDPDENEAPISSKTFTDFDNTLFKDGKLTPLGEDIKARVAAGEDISILTAREATPENIQFIKDQIGVDEKDIVAGLTPEGKAGFLTPGSTFYDDNEDNLAAARKIAGVNVVDSKAPETTLFDRVQESGNDGIKQLYSTPESITELQDQALTTPSNINEKLGGNEELTTDLIAQNGEQKINAAIQTLVEKQKNPDTTDQETEEIDSHINLLEKGLAKTVKAAPAITENQPKLPTVSEITDAEYNDFVDKGIVTPERLNSIAEKVKNQEKLSDKEMEIFSDKTGEVNKIIAEAEGAGSSGVEGKSDVVVDKASNVGGDVPTSLRGVKYSDIVVGDKHLEDILSDNKLSEDEKQQVREIFARGVDYFKFDKEGEQKFQEKFSNPEDITDVADIITGVSAAQQSAFNLHNTKNYENVKDAVNYIANNPNEYSPKVIKAVTEIKQKLDNPSSSMNRLYAIDVMKELGVKEQSLSKQESGGKAPVTKPEGKSDVVGNQQKVETKRVEKVAELEAERDMAILREGKPEVKMEFVTAKELVDSKDPIGNKKIHTDIKDRYKKMRELLDCLWT